MKSLELIIEINTKTNRLPFHSQGKLRVNPNASFPCSKDPVKPRWDDSTLMQTWEHASYSFLEAVKVRPTSGISKLIVAKKRKDLLYDVEVLRWCKNSYTVFGSMPVQPDPASLNGTGACYCRFILMFHKIDRLQLSKLYSLEWRPKISFWFVFLWNS